MRYLRHAEIVINDSIPNSSPDYVWPGRSTFYRVGCGNAVPFRELPVTFGHPQWHYDKVFAAGFYSHRMYQLDHNFNITHSWPTEASFPETVKIRGYELLVSYEAFDPGLIPFGVSAYDARSRTLLRNYNLPIAVDNFDFLDWDTIVFSTEDFGYINGAHYRGLLHTLNLRTGELGVFADVHKAIERPEFVQCYTPAVDRCGNVYIVASQGMRQDGTYVEGWIVKFNRRGERIWARMFPTGIQNLYGLVFNRTRTYLYTAQYGWRYAAQASYWPDFNNDKPFFRINPADGSGTEKPYGTIPFKPLYGAAILGMTFPLISEGWR